MIFTTTPLASGEGSHPSDLRLINEYILFGGCGIFVVFPI